MNIAQLKIEQKALATKIRTLKNQRKSHPCGWVPTLDTLRLTYRARHIIYCLLKGRTMAQIESRRVKNPPDSSNATECYLRYEITSQWKTIAGDDLLHRFGDFDTAEKLIRDWVYVRQAHETCNQRYGESNAETVCAGM